MVTKTRVVLEVGTHDGAPGNATTPQAAWATRREIGWSVHTETLGTRTPTDPAIHAVTVALINAGEGPDGTRLEIMRMTVDVETQDEDPLRKAMAVLDLATPEREDGPGLTLGAPEGRSVIGPMPPGWALGKRLTGYESDVDVRDAGSGMSAWQINGGSWVLLPLVDSGRHVVLTVETVAETIHTGRMDVLVERRLAGDAREGVGQELHATMPQIVRFDTGTQGFVIEAGDARRSWRFQGHAEARQSEGVSMAWTIVHDLHFDD